MYFEWILGASGAPLCLHFGLQNTIKKPPSSKNPSRNANWAKGLYNDAKWTPKTSKIH